MCQSLTQTVPASSWAATSRARWLSVLQTPADSPYSVSLAIRIAWSVLSARITARTGPKISSRAIVMSLRTSVKIVGSTQKPRSKGGPAGLDVAQDPHLCLSRDDRAEIRGGVERVPDRDRLGPLDQAFHELVVHGG